MHSIILSVLRLEPSEYYYKTFNLYHEGDKQPFANLFMNNNKVTLRVNSGEICKPASSVNLGRYAKS